MKQTINITDNIYDMQRFSSPEHLRDFYESRGLDGVELMFVDGALPLPHNLTKSEIIGVHLNCMNTWLDFWNGDIPSLLKEYVTIEEVEKQFGGLTRDALIKKYQAELDIAEKLHARYIVFHVCDISSHETTDYIMNHTDEEVIKAAVELINLLTEGKDYHFEFLCENLWWPGLNFRNPEITRQLMEGIKYPRKGIMLDTGHLMHLNPDLKNQDDAIDFILETLDRHGDLCRYIHGMHFHQSITGDYVREAIKHPIRLEGDYFKKMCDIMMHVYRIDSHRPFTTPRAMELINRVKPKFLTHELITSSLEEHEQNLDIQLKTLKSAAV